MPRSLCVSRCANARCTLLRWLTYARLRADETFNRDAPVETAAVACNPGTPPRYVASGAPFNWTIQRFAGYVARLSFFADGEAAVTLSPDRTAPPPVLATTAAKTGSGRTNSASLPPRIAFSPLPQGALLPDLGCEINTPIKEQKPRTRRGSCPRE